MSSRLLSFSLGLNLLLLGVTGYWAARSPSDGNTSTELILTTNRVERSVEFTPAVQDVAVALAPLRWDELESEDYPTYLSNLRKAGCPEPVLRRIIGAEVKE